MTEEKNLNEEINEIGVEKMETSEKNEIEAGKVEMSEKNEIEVDKVEMSEKKDIEAKSEKKTNGKRSGELKDWVKSIIIAAFIAVLLMQLIVPTVVREHSMEPSFYGGDYLIVGKINYKISSPHRGDVIIFKSDIPMNTAEPSQAKKLLIKRIIGMPGDVINISDNEVSINGKVIDEPYINEGGTPGDVVNYVVPKDSYFVMGDNRTVSIDSRRNEVGPVHKDRIIGKALIRLYPFNKIGLIK